MIIVKKGVIPFLVVLFLIPIALADGRVEIRGTDNGILTIDDYEFSDLNSKFYGYVTEKDGECYGSLSLNLAGENDDNKVYLNTRLRLKDDDCVLNEEELKITKKTLVYYKITTKPRREIIGTSKLGYYIYKTFGGDTVTFRDDVLVDIDLEDGILNIHSDEFDLSDMVIEKFKFR